MSRFATLAAVALFSSAVFFGARAVLLLTVTLATQDPRDYQPLVRSSIEHTALTVLLSAAFVAVARGKWRWFALLPVALCALAWFETARQWSTIFH
jgi:hypothetical protein